MKYEVKMSCGHTETIQLFGKCADRERKIEWLERYGLCEECKKEQAAKEIKKSRRSRTSGIRRIRKADRLGSKNQKRIHAESKRGLRKKQQSTFRQRMVRLVC